MNTWNSSDSVAMLAQPPHQRRRSRLVSTALSAISRDWLSTFSSQAETNKVGSEMMKDSSLKSALDLLKLLGLIVPQLLVLIFVSVLLITDSVDVMRHSADLKQHVLRMEPIRLVITQLQREREMTCVLISTDR